MSAPRSEAGYPWGNVTPDTPHWGVRVPWDQFTYGFDFDTGVAHAIGERFSFVRDQDGNVTGYRKIVGSLDNHQDRPVMRFEQVMRLYEHAAQHDMPLKHAYAQLYGIDHLPPFDQRRLAKSPAVYFKLPTPSIDTSEETIVTEMAALRKVAATAGENPVETPVRVRRRRSVVTPEAKE